MAARVLACIPRPDGDVAVVTAADMRRGGGVVIQGNLALVRAGTSSGAPAAGGVTIAQVDQRIATWARTGNTDQIPANKLGNAPSGGGGGGLTTQQVESLIADWAEEGDTSQIPANKLQNAPATPIPPIPSQSDIDARVRAVTADWAEEGNIDLVPENKLPANIGSGLDEAAVDARIASFARAGNTAIIPWSKLPVSARRVMQQKVVYRNADAQPAGSGAADVSVNPAGVLVVTGWSDVYAAPAAGQTAYAQGVTYYADQGNVTVTFTAVYSLPASGVSAGLSQAQGDARYRLKAVRLGTADLNQAVVDAIEGAVASVTGFEFSDDHLRFTITKQDGTTTEVVGPTAEQLGIMAGGGGGEGTPAEEIFDFGADTDGFHGMILHLEDDLANYGDRMLTFIFRDIIPATENTPLRHVLEPVNIPANVLAGLPLVPANPPTRGGNAPVAGESRALTSADGGTATFFWNDAATANALLRAKTGDNTGTRDAFGHGMAYFARMSVDDHIAILFPTNKRHFTGHVEVYAGPLGSGSGGGGGGGGGGGRTAEQVEAQIEASVADFAETGNTDAIPAAKQANASARSIENIDADISNFAEGAVLWSDRERGWYEVATEQDPIALPMRASFHARNVHPNSALDLYTGLAREVVSQYADVNQPAGEVPTGTLVLAPNAAGDIPANLVAILNITNDVRTAGDLVVITKNNTPMTRLDYALVADGVVGERQSVSGFHEVDSLPQPAGFRVFWATGRLIAKFGNVWGVEDGTETITADVQVYNGATPFLAATETRNVLRAVSVPAPETNTAEEIIAEYAARPAAGEGKVLTDPVTKRRYISRAVPATKDILFEPIPLGANEYGYTGQTPQAVGKAIDGLTGLTYHADTNEVEVSGSAELYGQARRLRFYDADTAADNHGAVDFSLVPLTDANARKRLHAALKVLGAGGATITRSGNNLAGQSGLTLEADGKLALTNQSEGSHRDREQKARGYKVGVVNEGGTLKFRIAQDNIDASATPGLVGNKGSYDADFHPPFYELELRAESGGASFVHLPYGSGNLALIVENASADDPLYKDIGARNYLTLTRSGSILSNNDDRRWHYDLAAHGPHNTQPHAVLSAATDFLYCAVVEFDDFDDDHFKISKIPQPWTRFEKDGVRLPSSPTGARVHNDDANSASIQYTYKTAANVDRDEVVADGATFNFNAATADDVYLNSYTAQDRRLDVSRAARVALLNAAGDAIGDAAGQHFWELADSGATIAQVAHLPVPEADYLRAYSGGRFYTSLPTSIGALVGSLEPIAGRAGVFRLTGTQQNVFAGVGAHNHSTNIEDVEINVNPGGETLEVLVRATTVPSNLSFTIERPRDGHIEIHNHITPTSDVFPGIVGRELRKFYIYQVNLNNTEYRQGDQVILRVGDLVPNHRVKIWRAQ